MSTVVGLDFGLTNCSIAAAGRGGVDVVLNGNSNRLNPVRFPSSFFPFRSQHSLRGGRSYGGAILFLVISSV